MTNLMILGFPESRQARGVGEVQLELVRHAAEA